MYEHDEATRQWVDEVLLRRPRSTELASVPTSVQRHLDNAHALASNGRHQDADFTLRQAATELAKTAPEMAALLMAGELGFREITAIQTEIQTDVERVEQRLFGIVVGEQLIPVTRTRTLTRTLRLS